MLYKYQQHHYGSSKKTADTLQEKFFTILGIFFIACAVSFATPQSLSANANTESINLFTEYTAPFSKIHILPIEDSEGKKFRWVLGPTAGVKFHSCTERLSRLFVTIHNPFPDQQIDLYCNGQKILTTQVKTDPGWLQNGTTIEATLPIRKGLNEVVFDFKVWNGQPIAVLNDPRPLSCALTHFYVE